MLEFYQRHEDVLTAEADGRPDGSFQGGHDDAEVQRAAHVDEGDGHEDGHGGDEDDVDQVLGPDDGQTQGRRRGGQHSARRVDRLVGPQTHLEPCAPQEAARHVHRRRPVGVRLQFRYVEPWNPRVSSVKNNSYVDGIICEKKIRCKPLYLDS